ncbi:MarR family winged helix-turn-helix transcriptional regulator [Sneathiella aquimaris]|uniref:MarR family winged helix-turn-helix transcriptional regulator n=1 Tax=Sneathiella aquimaris TaxID=2599305 RepID=UPI00146B3DB1|nr:MarR family transcriptional regulator [Sneathiella aquimaris]
MSQEQKNRTPAKKQEGSTTESIVTQWNRERPDLDASPMAVCGDIWRAGIRLNQAVIENASQYGLDFAGMDVLLTLRRQGKGETLTPKDLAKDMMLSTAAMTNRLDRLEKRGLIVRNSDPQDRRSLKVSLTDEGFDMADELVTTHTAREAELIKNLSKEEQQLLQQLLSKVG